MKNLMKLTLVSTLLMVMGGNISAQEVTMFPGFLGTKYYQDDTRIDSKELKSILYQDAAAKKYLDKSDGQYTGALVAFGAEVGFLIWQLSRASNHESQTVPFVGVLVSGVVSIVLSLSSNSNKKKAILAFNKSLDSDTSFRLSPSKSGLGIALNF